MSLLRTFAARFGIPAVPLSQRGDALIPYAFASGDPGTLSEWERGGARLGLAIGPELSCLSLDEGEAGFLWRMGMPFSHATQSRGGMRDYFYRGLAVPGRISLFGRRVDVMAGSGHVPEGMGLVFADRPLPPLPDFIIKELF